MAIIKLLSLILIQMYRLIEISSCTLHVLVRIGVIHDERVTVHYSIKNIALKGWFVQTRNANEAKVKSKWVLVRTISSERLHA